MLAHPLRPALRGRGNVLIYDAVHTFTPQAFSQGKDPLPVFGRIVTVTDKDAFVRVVVHIGAQMGEFR